MSLRIIVRFRHTGQLSLLDAIRRAGLRPLLGLILVIATALSLAGCARPVSALPFTVNGAKLALYEGPSKGGGAESTPLFSLARPVTVDRAGMAFFLRYTTGERKLAVQVYARESSGGAGTDRTIIADLPVVEGEAPAAADARAASPAGGASASPASGGAAGRAVELMVPVPAGVEVTGFRVEGLQDPSELALQAAGIAPLGPGVALGSKLVSLRPGFSYAETGVTAGDAASTATGDTPGATARVERFSFEPVTRGILDGQHASQVQVVLTYAFGPAGEEGAQGARAATAGGESAKGSDRSAAAAPAASPAATAAGNASGDTGRPAGRVELTFARGKEERSYLLTPDPGEHTVYVYSASCRFSPESLQVDSSDPAFRVVRLEVNPFSPDRLAPGTPIPADLGTILTYDPAAWRTKDFELFSWSLVPDVLVFDFRNYDVQGDYLSRFAYFIEKKGFAGRLLSSAELTGLHGWNAHDYRPQDIAKFYQTAEEEGFTLRPEENRLRDLLVQNGIIKRVAGRWEPGKGAIISVAQSSWYLLRYLLLTHEAFHGIYFTHPDYRAEIRAIWDGLDPEERQFWRLFLGSQDYNTEDRYLVVNEFEAYLMQQPLQAVDARYSGWAAGYVARRFPSQAPALERMIHDRPEIFLDTAKRVDAAVFRAAGVHAGELVTLVPQDWK